jgi:hypothetical protein
MMILGELNLFAVCGAISGLGVALLIQCGANKRARPKKAPAVTGMSKSKGSVRGQKPSSKQASLETASLKQASLKTPKSVSQPRSRRSAKSKVSHYLNYFTAFYRNRSARLAKLRLLIKAA